MITPRMIAKSKQVCKDILNELFIYLLAERPDTPIVAGTTERALIADLVQRMAAVGHRYKSLVWCYDTVDFATCPVFKLVKRSAGGLLVLLHVFTKTEATTNGCSMF